MYAECRHVLPAGLKCTLPQVADSPFCYRHRNLHERMCAPAPRPGTPFRLPSLEDSHGCLNAIQEVAWAMGDKRISLKEAGMYFHAINISKSLLPRRPSVTRKPVRTLCYDNDGFEMAEAVDACEPPRDCLTCPKTNTCEWFEYYEDQVEELEEQMAEEEEEKRQAELGTEAPATPKGKYDDELPNVRALLELMDRKAEAEAQERAQQEEKARVDKERAEQEKQKKPNGKIKNELNSKKEKQPSRKQKNHLNRKEQNPFNQKKAPDRKKNHPNRKSNSNPAKNPSPKEPLLNRLTG